MSSPFPGMDPYLEDGSLWPMFHHQLVTSLYQILLPGLVDRYRARIAQRHYTTEQPLFTSIMREELAPWGTTIMVHRPLGMAFRDFLTDLVQRRKLV